MTNGLWFQMCQVQLALARMTESTEELTQKNWVYRVPYQREFYRWTQSAEGWFRDVDFRVSMGIFGF